MVSSEGEGRVLTENILKPIRSSLDVELGVFSQLFPPLVLVMDVLSILLVDDPRSTEFKK
jgi:hypothetical protein